jgi:WD40 repeat protein
VRGTLQLADGRLLSWSGDDNTLRLWDADGTAAGVLEGHTSSVFGALQLADGRLLSWSPDNTLRLWDANGAPSTVLEGHTSGVFGTLQLADGRLLSWSGDGTLRLWQPTAERLIEYACTRVFRDLTVAERSEFGVDDSPTCPQFAVGVQN